MINIGVDATRYRPIEAVAIVDIIRAGPEILRPRAPFAQPPLQLRRQVSPLVRVWVGSHSELRDVPVTTSPESLPESGR